jgi:hypothetical protein
MGQGLPDNQNSSPADNAPSKTGRPTPGSTAVYCASVAPLRREQPFGPVLTHFDEAAANAVCALSVSCGKRTNEDGVYSISLSAASALAGFLFSQRVVA